MINIRADLLGLSLTCDLLASIVPDAAPPDVHAVFLAELLRYGSRSVTHFADAGAAALELELLTGAGGCHLGADGRLVAEPDHVERAVEVALARVLATSCDGSSGAIDALLGDYGMARTDGSIGCGPVAERVLVPTNSRSGPPIARTVSRDRGRLDSSWKCNCPRHLPALGPAHRSPSGRCEPAWTMAQRRSRSAS